MASDSSQQRRLSRLRRHKRVRKGVAGTPQRPRLAVFRSLRHIYAQIIDDAAGRTLAAASTVEPALRERTSGRPRRDQAAIIGQVVAERARGIGIVSVVFDRGGFRYHGRVRALAEGAREGGLEF